MRNRVRGMLLAGLLGTTLGVATTACEQREQTLGEKVNEAGEEMKDEAKDAAEEVEDEIDDAS